MRERVYNPLRRIQIEVPRPNFAGVFPGGPFYAVLGLPRVNYGGFSLCLLGSLAATLDHSIQLLGRRSNT